MGIGGRGNFDDDLMIDELPAQQKSRGKRELTAATAAAASEDAMARAARMFGQVRGLGSETSKKRKKSSRVERSNLFSLLILLYL